jgi:hypothetical protein
MSRKLKFDLDIDASALLQANSEACLLYTSDAADGATIV